MANFKKLGSLSVISAAVLLALVLPRLDLPNKLAGLKPVSKPSPLIISQAVYESIGKRNMLVKYAADGSLTAGELAEIATTSAEIKAEAVKVGKQYLLSTGSDGQVEARIATGSYKLAMIPIAGMDFSGVPNQIQIDGAGSQTLALGLKLGSGKVNTNNTVQVKAGTNKTPGLLIKLFRDTNGNGQKDADDPNLPWAGVRIRLQ